MVHNILKVKQNKEFTSLIIIQKPEENEYVFMFFHISFFSHKMNRFFKNSVLQNLKKSPSQKLGLNSKQFGSSFQYLHRANESGNLIFKRQISTLSAIQYSHIYSYMSFKRYFSDDFNKYKVIEYVFRF